MKTLKTMHFVIELSWVRFFIHIFVNTIYCQLKNKQKVFKENNRYFFTCIKNLFHFEKLFLFIHKGTKYKEYSFICEDINYQLEA